MPLSRKKFREITGFTFSQEGSNAQNWFNRACSFNQAAKLLGKNQESSLAIAYYFNIGLSLELILKAVIIAKNRNYDTTHKLNELCRKAEVNITKDQECTLELLSEIIIWSGRYPIPKNEGQWDNYHDAILQKHVVRKREGNTSTITTHKDRFPTLDNYLKIWLLCEEEYRSTVID